LSFRGEPSIISIQKILDVSLFTNFQISTLSCLGGVRGTRDWLEEKIDKKEEKEKKKKKKEKARKKCLIWGKWV